MYYKCGDFVVDISCSVFNMLRMGEKMCFCRFSILDVGIFCGVIYNRFDMLVRLLMVLIICIY